jgi:hypothetical protein
MAKSSLLFRVVDPRHQAFGMDHEGFVGQHFRLEGLLAQPLMGPSPHAFWPVREQSSHAGLTAEALPDLVGAAHRSIPCIRFGWHGQDDSNGDIKNNAPTREAWRRAARKPRRSLYRGR